MKDDILRKLRVFANKQETNIWKGCSKWKGIIEYIYSFNEIEIQNAQNSIEYLLRFYDNIPDSIKLADDFNIVIGEELLNYFNKELLQQRIGFYNKHILKATIGLNNTNTVFALRWSAINMTIDGIKIIHPQEIYYSKF